MYVLREGGKSITSMEEKWTNLGVVKKRRMYIMSKTSLTIIKMEIVLCIE